MVIMGYVLNRTEVESVPDIQDFPAKRSALC
jgi:hypothetical protein